MKFKWTSIAAAGCLALAAPAGAQEIELPDVIAWSAYDTGSAGPRAFHRHRQHDAQPVTARRFGCFRGATTSRG